MTLPDLADRVLVIDAGTSAMRAVNVRPDGAVSKVASVPWRVFKPADGSDFARELDATEIATSLADLMRTAAERGRPAGIALTGQRGGVVFLDEGDQALFVSPNIDGRAASEGMTIDSTHGQRIYAVTGHLPALMQAPTKLAWLRANRANVAERVRRIVPLVDWLGTLLTGEVAASRTLAAENGLLDISTGDVAAPLLEALRVAREHVPCVVAEGAAIGSARGSAFDGVPVALAGADTQCALAGMGLLAEGQAGVAAGWSAPVQLVAATPVRDAQARIWTSLHVAPNRWVLESNAGECGRAWDWLISLMASSQEEAERLAVSSPPGSRDAMTLLGPREMRASSMTVGVGALTVPLPIVMSAPERGDVLRSALEGLAYAIRANVEQLERVSGSSIGRLSLGGGMSRSPLFRRILADVIGRALDIASSAETSALGAAVVCSPAFGLHDTIERAAEAMSRPQEIVEPNMRTSAVYDDCYARWCALAEAFDRGVE
jgi:autoinducer 2 (AI-2) kinase